MQQPEQIRIEIFESSERLVARMKHPRTLPFDQLKPGYSFFVKTGVVQEASFRSMISNMSSLHNRLYKCVKHRKEGLFEVTVVLEDDIEKLPVVESSPLAKSMFLTSLKKGRKIYHFDKLPEGHSLTYPINMCSETAIRVACSLWSKKLKCKFLCIRHDEYGIFEVARLTKIEGAEAVCLMSPVARKRNQDYIDRQNKFLEPQPEPAPPINEIEFWNQPENI